MYVGYILQNTWRQDAEWKEPPDYTMAWPNPVSLREVLGQCGHQSKLTSTAGGIATG